MNFGLHFELITLIERFFCEEISEEEWALLQIHMAYCGECHSAFEARRTKTSSLPQPNNLI